MKILAFDSWTQGAHHLERLMSAFDERGLGLSLVHLGSWGNDPLRPPIEQIGSLAVRDIATYDGSSIARMLDVEKPDAVLLLSTETFAHRACIRHCRMRHISTLHLYHGIVGVEPVSYAQGAYKVDPVARARFIFSRFRKTFRRTLPSYAEALSASHATSAEWWALPVDLLRQARGHTFAHASSDARTTRCCVYTNADVEHAIRYYGFAPSDVFAVGNPDFARFGLTSEMIGTRIEPGSAAQNAIMYIETGLVTAGLLTSVSQFADHLRATAAALAAQGKRLIFKPKAHPAEYAEELATLLRGADLEIATNDDFLSRLAACAGCIVESTTLALVPALLGLPLLFAKYGLLKELQFGPVLTGYPRGYLLNAVEDVPTILGQDSIQLDRSVLRAWIADNSGPMPAENMPHRVAALVEEMVRSGA